MLFARQDPNFGLMLGRCPTTMRLFMTHLLSDTKQTVTLENPLHLQALMPCGFWLLPELKTGLKSYGFSDTANIHRHVMDILKSIPEERFQQCSEQWQHQLTQYMAVRGAYAMVTGTSCVYVLKQCLWQHSRTLTATAHTHVLCIILTINSNYFS